jgi:hypothetical protein
MPRFIIDKQTKLFQYQMIEASSEAEAMRIAEQSDWTTASVDSTVDINLVDEMALYCGEDPDLCWSHPTLLFS